MGFERVKDNSIQPMACSGCGNVFNVKTKDLDSGIVNAFTICPNCESKRARFKF